MRTPLAILAFALMAGCQYNPHAHTFTTTKPKDADVAGTYLLTQQTITTGGLSILRGQQCQLDLQSDGSFRLTNYPTWSDAFTATSGQFVATIATSGRWISTTVGTVSDGRRSKDYWGIAFSDTDRKLESLALTGKSPPYGLIMTYGDADSGTVMIFEKKK